MTEFFADLTGVRAKLGRAKEHLGALNYELRRLTKENANVRFGEFRQEGDWHILYYEPVPRFPIEQSLIVGDIINNLRAALDRCVWQLVLREGKKPSQTNDFPIFTSETDFINKVKYPSIGSSRRSSLYRIPVNGDAWTIIEQAQPWFQAKTRGYSARKDILAGLNLLSNIDKHRIVLMSQAVAWQPNIEDIVRWTPSEVQPVEKLYPLWGELSQEHPTELIRYRFYPDTKVSMYLDGRLPIVPSFGDENTQITGLEPITDRVNQIIDQISYLPRVHG